MKYFSMKLLRTLQKFLFVVYSTVSACFLAREYTHLLVTWHLLAGGEEVNDVVQEALVHF